MLRSTSTFVATFVIFCSQVMLAQSRNLDMSTENDSFDEDQNVDSRDRPRPIDGDIDCVRQVTDSDVVGCCGTLQYNKGSHLCCGLDTAPTIVEATFGEHSLCCQLGVYDDRVAGCCDGLPYNVDAQLCCNGAKIRGRVHGSLTGCCGPAIYNTDEQVCCADDTLRPLVHGPDLDCCGASGDQAMPDGQSCCLDPVSATTIAYDPVTHLCCDGVIQPRVTEDTECCGSAVYNQITNVCCPDLLVGSSCCGTSAIGGPSTPGDFDCCGGVEAFDVTNEICCDDVIRQKAFNNDTACCGTAVYNSSSSVCCDGEVHCAGAGNFRC